MQNISKQGASCNKQDVCWRRSQAATSPAFQLQLCAQRNLQSLLGWPELCRVLAQAAARTAGRQAGRQGSLQSLFWFPGRNKARINVLWRARTSTGPPGGGGVVVWLQLPVMTPPATFCLLHWGGRGREGAGLGDHSSHWSQQGGGWWCPVSQSHCEAGQAGQ